MLVGKEGIQLIERMVPSLKSLVRLELFANATFKARPKFFGKWIAPLTNLE